MIRGASGRRWGWRDIRLMAEGSQVMRTEKYYPLPESGDLNFLVEQKVPRPKT